MDLFICTLLVQISFIPYLSEKKYYADQTSTDNVRVPFSPPQQKNSSSGKDICTTMNKDLLFTNMIDKMRNENIREVFCEGVNIRISELRGSGHMESMDDCRLV